MAVQGLIDWAGDQAYYLWLDTDGVYEYLTSDLPVKVLNEWHFPSYFPTTPESAPTTDYQIPNKKYVDDSVAAVAPLSVVSKSGAYLATVTDDVILCTGTWALTLYTAVGNMGKMLVIKNVSTGIITVTPAGAETIDGSATIEMEGENATMVLVSDGAGWRIL